MKNIILFILTLITIVGLSFSANAEPMLLASDDFVGISFWLISMGMLAATAFFFMERSSVSTSWRTSITVAGIITGIAFINYLYMRGVWVQIGEVPTLYRYVDWLITMPLQIIEFYLILAAVRKVPSGIFLRLLIGSLVMFLGGYLGQAGYLPTPMFGLVIVTAGWIYLLYEIFSGEAGNAATKVGNKSFISAYNALRMIVTVGWSIYPLGYVIEYLGGIDINTLIVIYNLADFVNKIVFGLIIWSVATSLRSK
jgi:bacteriorhodopsin